MHKGSKKKIVLSELLDLPKPGDNLLTERDFPQVGEQEPPRDESVSKSDDTIVEKEGPPPAARQTRSPVHQKASAETAKLPAAQVSNHAFQMTKPAQPVISTTPKLSKEKQQQAGTTTLPARPSAGPPVPFISIGQKPTVTAVSKPPTQTLPVISAPLKFATTTAVPQPPKQTSAAVSVGMLPMLPPSPKATPIVSKQPTKK